MILLIPAASETPKVAAEVIGHLRQEMSNSTERDNQLLAERGRLMAELDAVSDSLAQSSAAQVAAIEELVDASSGRLKEIGELFSGQVGTEVSKISEIAGHYGHEPGPLARLTQEMLRRRESRDPAPEPSFEDELRQQEWEVMQSVADAGSLDPAQARDGLGHARHGESNAIRYFRESLRQRHSERRIRRVI